MKLYGAVMSWNVTRCATALEEAGSDYEIVPINFATAEHKSPEHLARNVRTVPFLIPIPLSLLFFPGMEMHRSVSVRVLVAPLWSLSSTVDLSALAARTGFHYTGDRRF